MITDEYLSAVDLASDIRDKKLAPSEVVEETIRAIDERNPSINAFVYTNYDEAREKAKVEDDKLARGEASGAFFGVPTAAKDFIPGIPGWPGTFGGIKALSHMIDDHWGSYTGAMNDKGAIMIGKTNSPSLAFRGTCDNKMFGPTSTPFKPGYNSGGSSGGSAAAVGDGILLIAEGTDGGGSIRIPAAWCGCYGFKAGNGIIGGAPRPNAYGTCHPYCWDGTISRTVKDAAYALQAMAGYDPFDPNSIDFGNRDYIAALDKSIKGMRIGFTPDFGIFPVEPEIARMCEAAAKRFEDAGAIVEQATFDFKRSAFELAEAWDRMITISGGLGTIEEFKAGGIDLLRDHADDLPDELIYWVEDAYKRGYVDFHDDEVIRTEVFDQIQGAFQDYDLLLSPTLACHPVKNDANRNTVGPSTINGVKTEPLIGFCLTFFCNFTGNPAASIPAGLSEDGFPVGLQLIGNRYGERDLISASAAYERVSPWTADYEVTKNRTL